MSGRTYLSIGDVLTLLREEFPDVTISKIRFLESQGLVNPERSPSGYRKFFEADVERLRWVLRQQREHFLPLKVIRDRLADGEPLPAASSAIAPLNGKVPERAHAVAGAGVSGRGRSRGEGLAATTTAARTEGRGEEHATHADDEVMARILADASRRVARVPEGAREHAPLVAVPDPGAPHTAGHTDVQNVPREHDPAAAAAVASAAVTEGLRADPDAPHAGGQAGMTGAASTRRREASGGAHEQQAAPPAPTAPTAVATAALSTAAPGPTSPRHATGGGVAAPAPVPGVPGASGRGPGRQSVGPDKGRPDAGPQGGPAKRTSGGGDADPVGRAGGAAGGATGTHAATTGGIVTGASLTSDELCAASGLSEAELTGLQGFGLIEPIMVAGIPTFDEDALTVANLAAEFRKYGIEARHLRPYRNAVDREVGLIEQVIIPLLRQRNPESRQRAVEAATELGALGQTMRATLLRTALRRHVGG